MSEREKCAAVKKELPLIERGEKKVSRQAKLTVSSWSPGFRQSSNYLLVEDWFYSFYPEHISQSKYTDFYEKWNNEAIKIVKKDEILGSFQFYM